MLVLDKLPSLMRRSNTALDTDQGQCSQTASSMAGGLSGIHDGLDYCLKSLTGVLPPTSHSAVVTEKVAMGIKEAAMAALCIPSGSQIRCNSNILIEQVFSFSCSRQSKHSTLQIQSKFDERCSGDLFF